MFHIGTIPAENFPRDLHRAAGPVVHMLQENLSVNRLAQAVAAAERADSRLLEKPLNDLVTKIKVRGLIAKMVLVTARQTLRALPMAEAGQGVATVEPAMTPAQESRLDRRFREMRSRNTVVALPSPAKPQPQ